MSKTNRRIFFISIPLLILSIQPVQAQGILVNQDNTLTLIRQDGQVQVVERQAQTNTPTQNQANGSESVRKVTPPTTLQAKYQLFSDALLKVFSNNKNAQVTVVPDLRPLINTSLDQVSPVYEARTTANEEYVVHLAYTPQPERNFALYTFDVAQQQWVKQPSYNDIDARTIISTVTLGSTVTRMVVLADASAIDGKASWYDQSRYKSFQNKGGMFAAHRTYPKGTKLKVTRLKTGQSIIITVNDWGPEERTGRIIDLDKQAFQAIATTGAGEVYVQVELVP